MTPFDLIWGLFDLCVCVSLSDSIPPFLSLSPRCLFIPLNHHTIPFLCFPASISNTPYHSGKNAFTHQQLEQNELDSTNKRFKWNKICRHANGIVCRARSMELLYCMCTRAMRAWLIQPKSMNTICVSNGLKLTQLLQKHNQKYLLKLFVTLCVSVCVCAFRMFPISHRHQPRLTAREKEYFSSFVYGFSKVSNFFSVLHSLEWMALACTFMCFCCRCCFQFQSHDYRNSEIL